MRRSVFLLLTSVAGTSWGQEEVYNLGEVVVTATRQVPPFSGSSIGRETIDTLSASTSDTATLLRDVPGVSLYGAGGVSSLPVIHGLADDRLRVQVDGMDLIAACPNHMNSPLSYIDPTSVASVKVYAGVAPVSVGGDSIGGAIVVKSAQPQFAQPGGGTLTSGKVGAFYRSNGNAMGANANLTVASEKLSVTYTGSTAQSDDYKAGGDFKTAGRSDSTDPTEPWLDGDVVGSSAYQSVNQMLDIAFRGENGVIDLKLRHQHIPNEGFPNQRMDMTDNKSDQIDLGYTGQYQWGVLKARAYYEHTQHEMDFGEDKQYWYPNYASCASHGFVSDATYCAAGMPMYTDGKNTGLEVKGDILLSGRDTLRVGAGYQAYRLDDWWPPSGMKMWPGTFWNINDGQRDRYALFGEWEARFSSQWTSLLGVRHETVTMDAGNVTGYSTASPSLADQHAFNGQSHAKTDRNWDLTASARYTPDAGHSYDFGVARKTRSPNLYERYSWSTWSMAAGMNNFVGDGNGYVGDPNLKPEVAYTASVTADWHDAAKSSWGLTVTPYYTYVYDFIDAECATGCTDNAFNVLRYVNQSASLFGIDIAGHRPLASTRDYGDFSLSGLLNYTRGRNETTGDNLYNIMPFNAKLAVSQKVGRWTNTVEAQFVTGKHDVSGVRNEIETAGYSLVNLRTSYIRKQVRLDVGIENLFDRYYGLPLGGAYVGQGKTMSFSSGPAWGVTVPGMGRTIYTSITYKF
jgi:iron complex outermembrane receptor protein